MFRKTMGLLAAAMVGLSATAAAAGDGRWLFIGADDGGAGFIDLGSITGGPTPEFKLMALPAHFSDGDHSAMYFAMVRMRVNCAARTTQLLSAKGYSDVGDLVMNKGQEAALAVDPAEVGPVNALRVACGMPGAPHDKIFDSSTTAIHWWRLQ